MTPHWYTDEEGGNWKPWTFGYLVLPEEQWHSSAHSLAFENPASGDGNFARWDRMNGWTTTLEQAKAHWPNGRHGIDIYSGRKT